MHVRGSSATTRLGAVRGLVTPVGRLDDPARRPPRDDVEQPSHRADALPGLVDGRRALDRRDRGRRRQPGWRAPATSRRLLGRARPRPGGEERLVADRSSQRYRTRSCGRHGAERAHMVEPESPGASPEPSRCSDAKGPRTPGASPVTVRCRDRASSRVARPGGRRGLRRAQRRASAAAPRLRIEASTSSIGCSAGSGLPARSQRRRDLDEAARVGARVDLGLRREDVRRLAVAELPCGVGLGDVVDAGAAAADVLLGGLDDRQAGDAPQRDGRRERQPLRVPEVARVLHRDREVQRMACRPGRDALEELAEVAHARSRTPPHARPRRGRRRARARAPSDATRSRRC